MNEEERNDNKLIQQLRIEGAANNVTIVQQQNINTDFRGPDAHKKRRRFHVMEKMMWDLLDALPDPKLKSLEEFTVSVVNGHFQNQKNTAGYLGISQMKVSKTLRSGACDIKDKIAKALWKPAPDIKKAVAIKAATGTDEWESELINREALKPGAIIPVDSFDEIKEESREDKLARLVAEGKIIVKYINRNEL